MQNQPQNVQLGMINPGQPQQFQPTAAPISLPNQNQASNNEEFKPAQLQQTSEQNQ
jgi:hypothetical protein